MLLLKQNYSKVKSAKEELFRFHYASIKTSGTSTFIKSGYEFTFHCASIKTP